MLAVQLHCDLVAEQRRQCALSSAVRRHLQAVRRRTRAPIGARILGKPRRGVIPAAEIERED